MPSTNNMTYDRETKTFYGDISEMGPMDQLYPDACDIGYFVRSSKTGKIVKFYLEREVLDDEGDLIQLIFKPCYEEVRKNSKLEGVSIVAYND